MRVRLGAFVLGFVALAAAGCGGRGTDGSGGDAGEEERAATCVAIAALSEPAAAVQGADVADPEAFDDVLDRAVDDYRDRLDALREVAPDGLDRAIDAVGDAVTDRDFSVALTARVPIDEWAALSCAVPAPVRE